MWSVAERYPVTLVCARCFMGRRVPGFLYTSITHRMKLNRLTTLVILAVVLGVLVGYCCHAWEPKSDAVKEIAG